MGNLAKVRQFAHEPAGLFVLANAAVTSVICTWVYNHTHGSLLIASLFHMTHDVAG